MSFVNARLAELVQIVPAIMPVDTQTGANNGDWVNMADFDRLTVIFLKNAGTGTDLPIITLKQATDVSGTGAKALNFTHIDAKEGAALTAVGGYTGVDQAAAGTYTPASATVQGLYVIEIQSSDLDTANSFNCVQLSVPDTGAAGAQLAAGIYILRGARYAAGGLPSAIV